MALIRKSDGIEFGVPWYQAKFDGLVDKLSQLLATLYGGKIYAPLHMCWGPDSACKGRRVLVKEPAAMSYLGRLWKVSERDQEACTEFSRLVGE